MSFTATTSAKRNGSAALCNETGRVSTDVHPQTVQKQPLRVIKRKVTKTWVDRNMFKGQGHREKMVEPSGMNGGGTVKVENKKRRLVKRCGDPLLVIKHVKRGLGKMS